MTGAVVTENTANTVSNHSTQACHHGQTTLYPEQVKTSCPAQSRAAHLPTQIPRFHRAVNKSCPLTCCESQADADATISQQPCGHWVLGLGLTVLPHLQGGRHRSTHSMVNQIVTFWQPLTRHCQLSTLLSCSGPAPNTMFEMLLIQWLLTGAVESRGQPLAVPVQLLPCRASCPLTW